MGEICCALKLAADVNAAPVEGDSDLGLANKDHTSCIWTSPQKWKPFPWVWMPLTAHSHPNLHKRRAKFATSWRPFGFGPIWRILGAMVVVDWQMKVKTLASGHLPRCVSHPHGSGCLVWPIHAPFLDCDGRNLLCVETCRRRQCGPS